MPNRVIEDDAEHIVALTFCRDGLRLVGADADGTIHVWDGPNLDARWRLEDGRLAVLHDLAVALDGRHAVAVGVGAMEVWDLDAGMLLRAIDMPAGREVQAAVFISNDRFVALGDAAQLWTFDLDGHRKSTLAFGGERNALTLLSDARTLVCAAAFQGGSRIQIARVADGIPTSAVQPPIKVSADSVSRPVASPDGRHVAYTARHLEIVDIQSSRVTLRLDTKGEAVDAGPREVLERRWSAPVFLDDRTVACGTPDGGAIQVYDVVTKCRVDTLDGHGERHISALAVSGNRLASAGRDFAVRLTTLR